MMSSDSSAVAGGLARHIPVLARRAVTWLGVRDGGVYVDATFGAGGYARAILATPGARVIGIDRDDTAIAAGAALVEEARGRLTLVEGRFSELDSIAAAHGAAAVDGVVFDLGVSSMQIDEAARGFSFRLDGPLDMRMGRDGPSAADVVARAGERDLAFIIAMLGEERHARAIARAIVKARASAPDRHDAGARRHRRADRAQREKARSTRPRELSRRCGFSSTTSLPNWRAASPPPSACSSRRGALSSSPSIRSRIASSKPSSAERSRAPASSRHRPQIDRGAADLPRADAAAGNAGRSRDRRQPAGAIGEAPRRRAHRCAPRAPRRSKRCCRGCLRSPTSCGGAHDPAHPQFRGDRRAGAGRGLRLSHQIRLHRAGRTARQDPQRSAPRARHHRGVARRVGRTRQSGAHRSARQALSAAQAGGADAIQFARSACPTVRRNSSSPTARIRSAS